MWRGWFCWILCMHQIQYQCIQCGRVLWVMGYNLSKPQWNKINVEIHAWDVRHWGLNHTFQSIEWLIRYVHHSIYLYIYFMDPVSLNITCLIYLCDLPIKTNQKSYCYQIFLLFLSWNMFDELHSSFSRNSYKSLYHMRWQNIEAPPNNANRNHNQYK